MAGGRAELLKYLAGRRDADKARILGIDGSDRIAQLESANADLRDAAKRLTADLAAVRAERDGYKAALLRTDATVMKYRDEYDEDSQMLREISHDIDGTLMQFDPEFATPADPQAAKDAPSA